MIARMDLVRDSVLVIESHPMLHEALCNAIAEEPDLTVVELVAQGREASQMVIATKSDLILLASKPDIILLTLGNPGSDGLEMLGILQATLPGIPILALTSSEVPGQEQAALEAGAQVVLTKAASRDEIIHALREMLRQNSISDHQNILEQEANQKTSQ